MTIRRDVLAPAQLGPISLRNRVIKAATFEGMTPGALVSDALIDYHRAVSAGGVGMSTVAYLAVAPEGRTEDGQIWMRPEALPGLQRLTDAIHAEGAAAAAQIGHAGAVGNQALTGYRALAPSILVNPLSLKMVKAATRADIERIRLAHGAAARMAADIGFDAIEIHFGHNYFTSSFLSPLLNRRRDEYGGSLANRARVARQTAETVRAAVGSRCAVLAKINMDDGVMGGLHIDEAIQTIKWLEEDGSLDAVELTVGSSLINPMYLFRGEAPIREWGEAMSPLVRLGLKLFGGLFLKEYPFHELFLLAQARMVRAEVGLPLVLLGGVTNLAAMNLAMDEGFDFVAMARALLREPDLINRIHSDRMTPSLCIHCNKCMATIYRGTRCVVTTPAAR
ncbi:2,4-dienoyl-CoA reductase-like NADH-dependent reductase (Old Yellow Enzyme family) [Mycobacterium sp. BK086]|uniref:NADH:flavin oxidoreductase n=1 Tax=Mycobacterium sp. BK086 TaxID=2512165 RepID=UPI001061F789|nr:NADH:flavin oxidoreductase [Mycobacterium sp. BK086]TDO09954.1 2,4-dienoyl-CoA reductase-like NADH-dependent reductase (Old Yellow Enzyme family) [Mycobacterium sp. BK086]